MANFQSYFETLMKHEGGYVDNPSDHGGPTKWGVTLATWVSNGYDKDRDGDIDKADLQQITKEDAFKIAKKLYWDAINADYIANQSVAEFIFDWAYNSGVKTASKKVQQILAVKPQDGIIGPQTMSAINNSDQECLFLKLKARRESFFRALARNSSQAKFLKGWLARNNSFTFKP